jgi:16S rRNA (guanine966-N2)-methyltransferase
MAKAQSRGKTSGKESQLRVIGGSWRGRKLSFIPEEGLRPTPDRIRETLFNWLTPEVHGARCADLFAGSGALGIEALSRGAGYCDFVDRSPTACTQISRHLEGLNAKNTGHCHRLSASDFLSQATGVYDVIFIDPPFSKPLASPTCHLLQDSGLLSKEALIYLESGADSPCPDVPAQWELHREKISGGVAYRLFLAVK